MFIVVNWDDRQPAYLQLRNQIVQLIAQGELTAHMALPSVRSLAGELGVNLHTVHKAFELLRDQGFIQLRPGSNATVRPDPGPDAIDALGRDMHPRLAEAWVKGLSRHEILQAVEQVLDHFQRPVTPSGGPLNDVRHASGGG